MEMELSMTSSVSNVEVTLENVKRKLDEAMDEPVMVKKIKTKQSSIPMDVVQTDDDDDDDDDENGGDDGTDDGDNDNTSLTLNSSNEIASTTHSKDHMVETMRESTTATRDFMLAERSDRIECPMYGQVVNRREFRRAGPYLIGLKLGHSPVDSIVQYLAKKENSNEFFQLKILVLNNNTSSEKLLQDERQGKMLLHTEYSLLSLLENQEGVMQQHGLFSVSESSCVIDIVTKQYHKHKPISDYSIIFVCLFVLARRIWRTKKFKPKILPITISSRVDYGNVSY